MDHLGRKIVGVAQRAVAAASAVVALPAGTSAVSVCADQACWMRFTNSGGSVSAAGTDAIYIPANVPRELPIPNAGNTAYTHIAAIRVSADGTLNIVALG